MNPIASTSSSPPPSAAVARTPVTAVAEVRPVKAVTDTPTTTDSKKTQAGESASASKVTDKDIQRATEDLQQRVKTLAPELQFSVDKSSGRSIITLTDRNTDEVIRQIPSEEALELTRAMDQFQRGQIFNRKA
jgi:flagellar protein FlaG